MCNIDAHQKQKSIVKTKGGIVLWLWYLKPWNWDGKQAWKWEDAASYLMEYQVPAADVLRKMEDVQLHDDGRMFFNTFN